MPKNSKFDSKKETEQYYKRENSKSEWDILRINYSKQKYRYNLKITVQRNGTTDWYMWLSTWIVNPKVFKPEMRISITKSELIRAIGLSDKKIQLVSHKDFEING